MNDYTVACTAREEHARRVEEAGQRHDAREARWRFQPLTEADLRPAEDDSDVPFNFPSTKTP